MTARPRSLALAVAAALALAAPSARADDQPEAVKLFDKGRALMQSAATLDEGCRTLEESLKLWDRGDTVLNLALCHRRQGKTATAWTEFDKALSHGTKVGFPEAIEEAKKQRAELAAILSKLTVTVPPATAALEGLTVEISGKPWPRERWNVAFVIDPGPVRVRARAKGYKPFEVQVEIGPDKDEKTVSVLLEVEPPPPSSSARSSASGASPSRRRAAASGVAVDRGRRRGGVQPGGDRRRDRLAAAHGELNDEPRGLPGVPAPRVRLQPRAQPRAARLRALRRAGNRRGAGPRGRGGGLRPLRAPATARRELRDVADEHRRPVDLLMAYAPRAQGGGS